MCSCKKLFHNIARRSPLIFSIFLHQILCTRLQSICETTSHKTHLAGHQDLKSEACPTMPCISQLLYASTGRQLYMSLIRGTGVRVDAVGKFFASKLRDHVSTCAAWCSEIGSPTSVDACNSGASSDHRDPFSLHQALDLLHLYMLLHVLLEFVSERICRSLAFTFDCQKWSTVRTSFGLCKKPPNGISPDFFFLRAGRYTKLSLDFAFTC